MHLEVGIVAFVLLAAGVARLVVVVHLFPDWSHEAGAALVLVLIPIVAIVVGLLLLLLLAFAVAIVQRVDTVVVPVR